MGRHVRADALGYCYKRGLHLGGLVPFLQPLSVASAVLCSLLMNCGHFAATSLTCGSGCSLWNPGCPKTEGVSRIPASPLWMSALRRRWTMADVLWRDTALTPKIFILDARAVFSPGPVALSLGLVDGGAGACRHCRALSGAAHRHDAPLPVSAPSAWPCMGRRTGKQETLKPCWRQTAAAW